MMVEGLRYNHQLYSQSSSFTFKWFYITCLMMCILKHTNTLPIHQYDTNMTKTLEPHKTSCLNETLLSTHRDNDGLTLIRTPFTSPRHGQHVTFTASTISQQHLTKYALPSTTYDLKYITTSSHGSYTSNHWIYSYGEAGIV